MDWKALGKQFATVGLPILGNAIAPGSGAIIALVTSALGLKPGSSPEQIAAATGASDALVKLTDVQNRHEEVLVKVAYDAEVAQVEAINKTLQTEAMGGSWLQRNHHAIESLMATSLVVAVYFVLPLLKIPVPVVPEFAYMMLGAILGVTAWLRGNASIATVKS